MAKKKSSFKILKKGDAGRQDLFKSVYFDFNDKNSKKEAEAKALKLEKMGYSYITLTRTGINKGKLDFVLTKKRKLKEMS